MSATGLTNPKAKFVISAHADYRREDFMFARTQSCRLQARPWENRIEPLKSWDRIVYPALAVTGLGGMILALLR